MIASARLRMSRVLLGVVTLAATATLVSAQDTRPTFAPRLATPDALEPFLAHLEPGRDGFAHEQLGVEIEARLGALETWLTAGPARAIDSLDLLAPGFRGGDVQPDTARAPAAGEMPLLVRHFRPATGRPSLDAAAFRTRLHTLVAGLERVTATEFHVTTVDSSPESDVIHTDVRFDFIGEAAAVAREAHVGTWRMTWRRVDASWQVVEWTTVSHVMSRANALLFTDVTAAAFAGAPSFARQLTTPLDDWMAALDAVLTRDSNGHHGVAVGDADGDGLDDLYVSQAAGLPNRLFRARGDGTFEDVTERAGLGLLDDTAHALFADVDNDGDQDLVVALSLQPLVFTNDGTGRFSQLGRAFGFARPLEGVLTGLAMADFDRDGYLDVYLCVYSYFFGAGEDKAGTPMPYHDARNGPPGMLFRNDGQGRFIDVTSESGLDEGNDRYHFAAAWADYDDDGWSRSLWSAPTPTRCKRSCKASRPCNAPTSSSTPTTACPQASWHSRSAR